MDSDKNVFPARKSGTHLEPKLFPDSLKETCCRQRIEDMAGDHFCVLVIDDEPIVAGAVEICLQRDGWKVHATLDAQEGVAMARSIKPDVILCDGQMPRLSGFELIAQLKADSATARIPVVLMSGIGSAEDFPTVPFACFLKKPFGAKELRMVVESAAHCNNQSKGTPH
jgi:CheY-like chemotaxis protein